MFEFLQHDNYRLVFDQFSKPLDKNMVVRESKVLKDELGYTPKKQLFFQVYGQKHINKKFNNINFQEVSYEDLTAYKDTYYTPGNCIVTKNNDSIVYL